MNGWLLVRIAGIVVGIATLLRVATHEGLVAFDPLFLAWMEWLNDFIDLGFLTKLIGPFLHWSIGYVRSFGISVPDLQDVWRPAFVLSMLMFGAMSRHSQNRGWLFVAPAGALIVAVWSGLTGSLTPVAAVSAVVALPFAFTAVVAVVYAVFSSASIHPAADRPAFDRSAVAAFAAVVAVAAVAVVALPFVFAAAFVAIVALVYAATFVGGVVFSRSSRAVAAVIAFPFAFVAFLYILGFPIYAVTGGRLAFAATRVIAFVACVASMFLITGILEGWRGGWRFVFVSGSFNTGIDILSVMLGALGIASLFANPPIW